VTATRATFIADILEEHLDELAFLWGQRRHAIRSPLYTVRAFTHLEERVSAHLDGLLSVGRDALPLLESMLRDGDELQAFAAACALLSGNDASSPGLVIDAFKQSDGKRLRGIRDALCHAPVQTVLADLRALSVSSQPALAVAATHALAFHEASGPNDALVRQFLAHDDPGIKADGWRLAGSLGMRMSEPAWKSALEDTPDVRQAALEAHAWCGDPEVLNHCRRLAAQPTIEQIDALHLLAVLGDSGDLARIEALGRNGDLGPDRFRVSGACGHPQLMDAILAGLSDADAATAAAAGAAFMKVTGLNVESGERAALQPDSPDEFDAAFADEVLLPDPARATQHWGKVKNAHASATRVCRGIDASDPALRLDVPDVDMESRWESYLRARFRGAWNGSPLLLERRMTSRTGP
jgi:uncharacterized protein (TIGR02270 family)